MIVVLLVQRILTPVVGLQKYTKIDKEIIKAILGGKKFRHYVTEKCDGMCGYFNIYQGELMDDQRKVIRENFNKDNIVRILAETSYNLSGKQAVIVITSNNPLYLNDKHVGCSFVTALAVEFGDMTHEEVEEKAKSMSASAVFKEIVSKVVAKILAFYDADSGRGDPSYVFNMIFEFCNKNNRSAWDLITLS